MNTLTPGQARTLRVLTKNGRLQSFATTLAEDDHSKSLRALVAKGYLTYEYTGTQRIYTLTDESRSRFSTPKVLEGKLVAKKTAKPADVQGEEKSNGKAPAVAAADLCRAAVAAGHKSAADALEWAKGAHPDASIDERAFKNTFSKLRKENKDESAPAPAPHKEHMEPAPSRSKADAPRLEGPSPTLTDLLAVGEMAAQHGGAKKLLALVALVDDLARKVGGIDRLRGSLEGLETLAKLFK